MMMMMMMMMMNAGLPVRHVLNWCKNSPTFSMGRLDYDYQHEPIFYTWKKNHKFYGKGEFKTSTWPINKPRECKLHPTMKPVELIVNAVLNSTEPGMIVGDPFLGSGSTLVACEKTGRVCYGMELDTHYCDVIVQRYIDHVGSNADCYLLRGDKKTAI
jgi:DNA modification methylase